MTKQDHEPQTRFSDRAAAYASSRPGYPSESIDAILEGLGDPRRLIVADIGAGTGISSRLLGDRGVRVVAIEPNAAMRAASRPHDRVEWREGTGERTGLETGSVDVVLCAQSFHWLDRNAAIAEFARVLKPGGRLALLWNIQDDADGVTARYRAIMERHAFRAATSPSMTGRREDLSGAEGFEGVETREFMSGQELDEAGLLARAESSSYAPKDGEAGQSLRRELRALFTESARANRITLRYRVVLHTARRVV